MYGQDGGTIEERVGSGTWKVKWFGILSSGVMGLEYGAGDFWHIAVAPVGFGVFGIGTGYLGLALDVWDWTGGS